MWVLCGFLTTVWWRYIQAVSNLVPARLNSAVSKLLLGDGSFRSAENLLTAVQLLA